MEAMALRACLWLTRWRLATVLLLAITTLFLAEQNSLFPSPWMERPRWYSGEDLRELGVIWPNSGGRLAARIESRGWPVEYHWEIDHGVQTIDGGISIRTSPARMGST